jgi:predicted Zn-dependent protease with MMP-like domain
VEWFRWNYRGVVPTRRRDRRGRGLRGVLAPRAVPLRRSRSDAFDDLVIESAMRLQRRWGSQLQGVEFLVEDVPPGEDGGGIALGASRPAAGERPPRIIVYRRPVETRATGERIRAMLVHDVVVEQVAELLGLEPETVDPDYGLDPPY